MRALLCCNGLPIRLHLACWLPSTRPLAATWFKPSSTILLLRFTRLLVLCSTRASPLNSKHSVSLHSKPPTVLCFYLFQPIRSLRSIFLPKKTQLISPFFSPYLVSDGYKAKLDFLDKTELAGGKHYLVGDTFTVADSYLYIVLSWSGYLGIDLSPYANVTAYYENIKKLPFVVEAHAKMAELSPK
jgi:hypothetical protein